MMKHITLSFLLLLPVLCFTQTRIWQTPVSAQDMQLMPNSVTLATLTVDVPTDGKVFVRFAGNCISSPGDRIVLAASDYNNWNTNDGNTWSYVYDSVHTTSCFNHTRVYDATAGTHTYYAIGHNYVDTNGSGIATIEGQLTVLYVPNDIQDESLTGSGAYDYIEWTAGESVLQSITIEAPVKGQIAVSFDAFIEMIYEDEALFTTNLSPSWPNHPEITPIMMSPDHRLSRMVHRKVYSVEAGTYEIYALAKKIVGELNNGQDYVYSTLSAHFIPDDKEEISIVSQVLDEITITDGAPERIGQLQITAPGNGKILVQCSGQSLSSLEDRITLSLVPNDMPDTTLSDIDIQPLLLLNPYTPFSLSALTAVTAGTYTYDVMADFDPISDGTGIAEISGLFSVLYVANPVSTSVADVDQQIDAIFYPNPTTGIIHGQIQTQNDLSALTLEIFNSTGQLIRRIDQVEPEYFQEDLGTMPDGQYLIKARRGNRESAWRITKSDGLK